MRQGTSDLCSVADLLLSVCLSVRLSVCLSVRPSVADCMQDVRDDALHLLDVLSSRIRKDALKKSKATAAIGAVGGGQSEDESQPEVAVVIGNLQDSYQQFRYQLSSKLARCTFPESLLL